MEAERRPYYYVGFCFRRMACLARLGENKRAAVGVSSRLLLFAVVVGVGPDGRIGWCLGGTWVLRGYIGTEGVV